MHFKPLCCLMATLLNPINFFAQQNQMQAPLSGQLSVAGSSGYSQLRVQLWDAGGRNAIAEAHVNPMGAFEFAATPSGSFELRVVNWQGEVLHSRGVGLPYMGVLPVKFGAGESGQARIPISLTRLQHKVPKKALKAFAVGRDAMLKGDRAGARLKLEEAIRLDPQFFEAANDLGVLYLGEGRLSEAYEMFQRATTLDEGDPQAEANLAYVLLALHRFPEAEEAARTSVRADSLSSRARYLLAVSLLEQRKSRKEVLFHLTHAKEHFEPARKLLQQLTALP